MDDDPRGDRAPPPPAPVRRRLMATLVLVAGLVLAVDQVTKRLALRHLEENVRVPVVGDLLQLRLVFNPGAAFSIGTGMTWLLTLIAVVVVVVVARVARGLGSRWWAVALGLLLGGALGNLVDRLTRPPGFARGHVVDFLELPRWPVFNVADSAISVAAVLIVVLALRGVGVDGRREGARRDEPQEARGG
jgi:signal peptidase II